MIYDNKAYSLDGDVTTQYLTDDEIFVHTVFCDSQQQRAESILHGHLSLENGDELLFVDDEELRLLSHENVLKMFNDLQINKQIELVYRSKKLNDTRKSVFTLEIVLVPSWQTLSEKDTLKAKVIQADDWKNKKCIPIKEKKYWSIKPKNKNQYLKVDDDLNLVFGPVESGSPGHTLWEYLESNGALFTQERWLCDGKKLKRFFKHLKTGRYLSIKHDCCIELCICSGEEQCHKHDEDTVDGCCCRKTALEMCISPCLTFQVLKEYDTDQCLMYQGPNQVCMHRCKYVNLEDIGVEFKFVIESVLNS